MTRSQLLTKVQFPLALPHILNGIKLALVEIMLAQPWRPILEQVDLVL